ncbi:uncharacterized protein Dvar_53740 [Desulfosarcina variabilis str. Montpellier]|uniref:hypothetical protein n=1 Tax=Desulfosarcina variabilis TaxID=2300 RepID=UPI003AFA678C
MTESTAITEKNREDVVQYIKGAVKTATRANDAFGLIEALLENTRRDGEVIGGDEKLFCLISMLETGISHARDGLYELIVDDLLIALENLGEKVDPDKKKAARLITAELTIP